MTAMRFVALALLVWSCGGSPVVPVGIDDSAMDLKANPCDDFYQYACGGWLASHPVPLGAGRTSRTDVAQRTTSRAVSVLLDEATSQTLTSLEAQHLRAYHAACMTGAGDRREVTRLLATVDAITPDGGLAPAIATLHAAGVDALFDFYGGLDLMRARHVTAELGSGGTGLPGRVYYVDPTHAAVLTAYQAHLAKLAGLLGVSDGMLAADALSVEKQLATATRDVSAAWEPLDRYHPTAIASLTQSYPAFDWSAYFAATGAPPFTSINVSDPGFFAALDALLRSVPLDTLKRYLRARVLEKVAFQLDDAITAEESAFHYGTFYGVTTAPPREAVCFSFTVDRLEWEMSSLYAARHASGLAAKVQPLVDDIRDRLWENFGRLDWLDAPTLELVRKKLDAMRTGVAAPADFGPWLLGPLTFPPDFASAESARVARERQQNLAIIETTWNGNWFMSPITVNAAYSPLQNAINLPAAILQAPLYKSSSPAAVNFGAIGSIIGHEITHGFDSLGHRFDEGGALRNMWSLDVQVAFSDRAQCVVDQYSAVDGAPGTKISGERTVGENIADLGGVKLAYLALRPTGAKLESFTDSQVFFLAYAQAWCTNLRPEYEDTLLALDAHSPPKARVNVVLSNTPEFATAWQCKEGQPMAPVKRCSVW